MILAAHLGISYACNMNCKHCFVKIKREDYVLKHYKEIIDDIFELGVLEIHYTYGEPLICKSFFEVANYVHQYGISQVLMSNGYFIDSNKVVEQIKQAGIKKVYISLDSVSEKEHDQNRRCINAFKKAIHAIQLLKEGGVIVGIANSISDRNVREMLKMYNLSKNLNVDQISFLRIRDQEGIAHFSDEEKEIYLKSVRELILKTKEGGPQIRLHDPLLKNLIEEMIENNQIDKGMEAEKYSAMTRCAMTHSISISPDGEISRCALSNYIIGNLKDSNWKNNLEVNKNELCIK